MTPLVAYLLLFIAVGVGFIFVHLLAGKLLRPNKPGAEKKTIYECGEPTIGSAWVQFDLRFYVIALLFVIFDVEVAFFFPWAEVFGKANAIRLTETPPPAAASTPSDYERSLNALLPANEQTRGERYPAEMLFKENRERAASIAWLALFDILIFFGVLLVGFAYLWKRGDLAWVRSVSDRAPAPPPIAAQKRATVAVGS